MMRHMSALSDIFDDVYGYCYDMATKRDLLHDYDWLLQGPLRHRFIPDYFLVSTVGSSWWVRLLNGMSVSMGRVSMGYYVMRRFIMLMYDVQVSYARHIGIDSDEIDDMVSTRDWLLTRLVRVQRSINGWCLIELFLFAVQWMSRVCDDCGFETMDMASIKADLNNGALRVLQASHWEWLTSEQRFYQLLSASSYANWLDIVVPNMMSNQAAYFSHIDGILRGEGSCNDGLLQFLTDRPRRILYKCDNAGEVIFDLCMIQYLIHMGHSVNIVAKQSPILNDVTVEDVHALIHEQAIFSDIRRAFHDGRCCVIVANSFAMVGKYLPLVTQQYKDAYAWSDLVWLKGQGNFQTMPLFNHYRAQYTNNYRKRLYISFVLKSSVVADCLKQVSNDVRLGHPFQRLI